MPVQHEIRVYDASGVQVGLVTDFMSLAYKNEVNAPGGCAFTVPGNHGIIALLVKHGHIEIYRRDTSNNLDWYRAWHGYYIDYDADGINPGTFKPICLGDLARLSWRDVAWKAGAANRSTFAAAKAETVINTLVTYNAAASATVANGRVREGAITGITVEADGAEGNTIDISCAYKNLLETIQKIALIGGGDFNLVKTAANAWNFRWYSGQLGTDRTATVRFAAGQYGTLASPKYSVRASIEKTVAIVGGPDEAANRKVAICTGDDYTATSNDKELFVDSRNSPTLAEMTSAGDKKLAENKTSKKFSFDVLQTPGCMVDVDYFLGDLVTAVNPFTDESETRKVVSISTAVEKSGEKISIDTAVM